MNQVEYTKYCSSQSSELNRFLPPAILAVRAELELQIGEETWNQIFENNMHLEENSLSKFFADMPPLTALAPEKTKDTPKKEILPSPTPN